jgi:hypothetical protein
MVPTLKVVQQQQQNFQNNNNRERTEVAKVNKEELAH